MKLKQRNLLLFLGGSEGEALDFSEAITSSALMPHTLHFLCRSQSLLFVLAGQLSFQVVRALMPLKIANLTPKQIEYRIQEADLVPPDFTYRGQIR